MSELLPSEDIPVNIEAYLLYIHAIPPSKIQKHLEDLLSNPLEELSRLEICVPELCARISNQIFDGQAVHASFLGKAVEAALNARSHVRHPQHLEALGLNTAQICRYSYLIGRLRNSALLAQFRLEREHSPILASELLNDKDTEVVLRALVNVSTGPVGIRELRKALGRQRGRQPAIDKSRLHDSLLLGVRTGLIEAQTIRGTLKYSLSAKGRRMLGAGPDYLPKVKSAYINYRQGLIESDDIEQSHLFEVFSTVDSQFSSDR